MARQVKKIGKQDMYRSEKPKIKEKKKKETIDEESQDQKMYLGNSLKELAEQAQLSPEKKS